MSIVANLLTAAALLRALATVEAAEVRLASLDPFALGKAPSGDLFEPKQPFPFPLDESPREVRQVKSIVAGKVWARLVPEANDSDLSATAVLYRGQLVTIDLVSPSAKFEQVLRNLVSSHGRGNSIADEAVPAEGCEPYSVHQWQLASGVNLYLIGGPGNTGAHVQVREEASFVRMESDSAVHIEHEQCTEF